MAEQDLLWNLAEQSTRSGQEDLYLQASTEGMLFGYASRRLTGEKKSSSGSSSSSSSSSSSGESIAWPTGIFDDGLLIQQTTSNSVPSSITADGPLDSQPKPPEGEKEGA